MSRKSFLLLSDIHATDVNPASPSAPSYVSSFNPAASGKKDPLSELRKLLATEELKPDYILCAGDITNRSSPTSLSYAWEKLNKLSLDLGAKLISTVGNHDIDSRYLENKFDPRGYAMALSPTIPVPDRTRFLEYWAQHFTVVNDEGCNLLVLNTAAYHGGGEEVAKELEHGRISELTLQSIENALSSSPQASVNVLLCHHHPLKPEQSDSELAGHTRGGEKLVELLASTGESWVIVHGHKHTPELFYGHGGGDAPVVLGCASFSAQVNADAQNKNPNQVHLLIVDPEEAEKAGVISAGEVLSWTWQPGVGWRRSLGRLGLPHRAGFGHRGSSKSLATKVEKLLPEGAGFVSWTSAVEKLPDLKRLIPATSEAFERILKDKGIVIARDSDGQPLQIGRTS